MGASTPQPESASHDCIASVGALMEAAADELGRLSPLVAEVQRLWSPADAPTTLCVDLAVVADWSPEEQRSFCAHLAEVVWESLETGDVAPARAFLTLMATPDVGDPSPTLTVEIDGAVPV